MAQPKKLDQDTIDAMALLVREGLPDSWVAESLNISARTFAKWKSQGREEVEGEDVKIEMRGRFFLAYARARGEWRKEMLAVVIGDARGGKSGPASARWLLEKRERADFGREPFVLEAPQAPAAPVPVGDATEQLRQLRAVGGGKK